MATLTLPSLRPLNDAQDGVYSMGGAFGEMSDSIDDDPDSPNTADFINPPANTSSGTATNPDANSYGCTLSGIPANFLSMVGALSVKVYCDCPNRVDDTYNLYAAIYKEVGRTTLLWNGFGGSVSSSAAVLRTCFGDLTAAGFAATKTEWENAVLFVYQGYNALMGADGAYIRIFAVELEASYIPLLPVTQDAYQFFADGTETGSTSLAAQNTGITVDAATTDVSVLLRLRLQVAATASFSTDDWQLQYDLNASGLWAPVGGVNGAEGFVDGYSVVGAGTYGPMDTGTYNGQGQTFTGVDGVLSSAYFRLQRNGNPTCVLTAVLYAHTGTFGTNGAPTGAALATSYPIDASSIPLASGGVSVKFMFDRTVTLASGTKYCIVVESTAANTSHYISVKQDWSGSATHNGNAISKKTAGGFDAWSARDTDFGVQAVTGVIVVDKFNSSNLTDAAATTNRLTGGSGSFVAGKISEDGNVDNLAVTANNFTELLYAITLKAAQLINTDVVTFRLVRNGEIMSAETAWTYSVTPTVTIAGEAVPSVFKVKQSGTFVTPVMNVKSGGSFVAVPLKVKSGGAFS